MSNKQTVRNILKLVRSQTGCAMIFTEKALVKALKDAEVRGKRKAIPKGYKIDKYCRTCRAQAIIDSPERHKGKHNYTYTLIEQ